MTKSNEYKIVRLKELLDRIGYSKATLYKRIQSGLFPPQVSLGGRAVGWLEHEVNTALAAIVAGQTNEEVKSLVMNLLNERQITEKD